MNIEKGIPLPPKQTKWANLTEEIEAGDSVFFPEGIGCHSFENKLRHFGFRAAHRKVKENGVDGIRVWAVAKKKKEA